MKVSNVEQWEVVARLLDQAATNLGSHSPSTFLSNPFDAIKTPNVTVYDYMKRLKKYTGCSESCYILCFIYIDRLLLNRPSFTLSLKNIHRVVLLALVVAIKYLDDVYADNNVYAKIGGISLSEFNMLEIEMIRLLDFDFYIDSQLYFEYLDKLHLHHQKLNEETMVYCGEKNIKPIRYSGSVASMSTIASSEK